MQDGEPLFLLAQTTIDVRGKDVGEVELLTIKAASLDSGLSLHSALRQFHPELDADETGDCIVRVELGNDKRTLEVFAAIDDFVAGRASRSAARSMSVASDERAGRQQGYSKQATCAGPGGGVELPQNPRPAGAEPNTPTR